MSIYAAVDIGSNSVRLAVADAVPNRFYQLLAADRQVTRIGQSVFTSGRVGEKAIQETCDVLARFATAYQKWQPVAVGAVATSAVRDAGNQAEFLARASKAVGCPCSGSRLTATRGPFRNEARKDHWPVSSGEKRTRQIAPEPPAAPSPA